MQAVVAGGIWHNVVVIVYHGLHSHQHGEGILLCLCLLVLCLALSGQSAHVAGSLIIGVHHLFAQSEGPLRGRGAQRHGSRAAVAVHVILQTRHVDHRMHMEVARRRGAGGKQLVDSVGVVSTHRDDPSCADVRCRHHHLLTVSGAIAVIHLEAVGVADGRPQVVVGVVGGISGLGDELAADVAGIFCQSRRGVVSLKGVPLVLADTGHETVTGIGVQTAHEAIDDVDKHDVVQQSAVIAHVVSLQSLILVVHVCDRRTSRGVDSFYVEVVVDVGTVERGRHFEHVAQADVAGVIAVDAVPGV